MRCDAIAARTGGCDSDWSNGPEGGAGAATLPPEDDPASAARATPRTSRQLAQRRTTLRVEHVDVADVDGKGDLVVQLEPGRLAGGELRDQVRPRRGDAFALLFL